MSPRISSPMHPSGGRGGRGGGRGGHHGGNVRRDRELIGKTIKITGGPYKGKSLKVDFIKLQLELIGTLT